MTPVCGHIDHCSEGISFGMPTLCGCLYPPVTGHHRSHCTWERTVFARYTCHCVCPWPVTVVGAQAGSDSLGPYQNFPLEHEKPEREIGGGCLTIFSSCHSWSRESRLG